MEGGVTIGAREATDTRSLENLTTVLPSKKTFSLARESLAGGIVTVWTGAYWEASVPGTKLKATGSTSAIALEELCHGEYGGKVKDELLKKWTGKS